MSDYKLSQTGAVIQQAITKMAAVTVTADQINEGVTKAEALTHTAAEIDAGVTKIGAITQTAAEMQEILNVGARVASPDSASSGQVLTADGSGGTSWAAGGGGSGAVSSVDGKTGAVTLTDTYLGLSGGTLTGTLNIGTTETAVYTGVCTWRKCANDSGNVHQAAFFVNSDGTAKFVNRGASGSADTASLTFGAGGFKCIMGTSKTVASIDANGGVTITGELTGPDHTGGTATFGYLAENAKTTEIFMSAGEVTITASEWTASTDAAGYYEAAAAVDGMCACYHQMTLIAASGIVPTETERTEFSKIVHITDADSTTLKLYATAAPTCDLNIAISGTYVLL
jgi:hypothetical protein